MKTRAGALLLLALACLCPGPAWSWDRDFTRGQPPSEEPWLEIGITGGLVQVTRSFTCHAGQAETFLGIRAGLEDAGWEEDTGYGLSPLAEGRITARFKRQDMVALVHALALDNGKSTRARIALLFESGTETMEPGGSLFSYPYGKTVLYRETRASSGIRILQMVECRDGPDLVMPRLLSGLAARGWQEPESMSEMRAMGLKTGNGRILTQGNSRLVVAVAPRPQGWLYTLMQNDFGSGS